ncbi:MAG: FHA domain-containing protein [Saprospiraceae bacterium]|nr:FHA domain-containing protein [Saprospiraceae bacterium]MDP4913132.1 FHA domain-containing protein [Saprospiraceae bacterium]
MFNSSEELNDINNIVLMIIVSIGRNPDNKVVIKDNSNSVSGNHGEIKIFDNGSMYYKDISRNGSMINGRLIHNTECPVQRGASIIFPNNNKLDWDEVPYPSQLKNVKEEISIGKNPDNKIQINASQSSRYHAVLKITSDGKYYIYDQSLNGTTVNGSKVPKYQDYLIKRKDKILFADSQALDWKQIPKKESKIKFLIPVAVLLIIGLISIGTYKNLTPVNISQKYNKAVCLVYNRYYLAYMDGQDTLYYIGENGIIDFKYESYKLDELDPFVVTGTGFFMNTEGEVVTNKHVAAPWESDLAIDKEVMQKKIGEIDSRYTGQIRYNPKIVGVPVDLGLFVNNSSLDKDDPYKTAIECDFIKIASEKEVDLALIQTKEKKLPSTVNFINRSDIISNSSEIGIDDDITIIGFPMGFNLALKNSESKIKSTSNHGKVSKISDKFEIQYDAGSTHGASGSPVFNKEGKLIAVNYAGMEKAQGFNFGIIATHVNNLLVK